MPLLGILSKKRKKDAYQIFVRLNNQISNPTDRVHYFIVHVRLCFSLELKRSV